MISTLTDKTISPTANHAPAPSAAMPTLARRIALRRVRTGFVGIDVGTRYLKLAQVDAVDNGWKLRAAEVVDLGASAEGASLPEGLGRRLRQTILSADFRGYEASCLLPDDCYQREFVEFDAARGADEAVSAHLAEKHLRGSDALLSDYWTFPLDEPGRERAEIVSVPTDTVQRLAEELRQAGLEVNCLDSPLTASAAAARMMDPRFMEGNVASIDWGDRCATLTLISNSTPIFARKLRDVGFRRLIQEVAAGLGVSPANAEALVRRYGATEAGAATSPGVIASELARHIDEMLRDVRDELLRTQSYLRRKFFGFPPERLILQGGGALHSRLRQTVGETLGLDPQLWNLDRLEGVARMGIEIPAFANAITLSTLAFAGASKCHTS